MIRAIKKDIYYIGADDTVSEFFENQYPTPQGMAYNSYVIDDERIAVLDTSDIHTANQWLDNLQEMLAGRTPDYLVIHHMEPDHSAVIPEVLKLFPSVTIVLSQLAAKMFPQFFDTGKLPVRLMVVGENDTLDLGKHRLQFLMAPMVHWPEVMVSYDTTEQILFSADAFGKFGALSECGFTDEEDSGWANEARRYYVNICGKFGVSVQQLLKKTQSLPLQMICSLHGPVISKNIAHCISLYDKWSRYEAEEKGVLIAYASIYGHTETAAKYLGEKLLQSGCEKVKLIDLCTTHFSYALSEVFHYDRIVLAASSYNASVFPPMYHLLHNMQEKACRKKRIGLIENGSWAPSAGRIMKEMIAGMKEMELLEPVVTIRSSMKAQDMEQLNQLCRTLLS